jgi:hypothetical protein
MGVPDFVKYIARSSPGALCRLPKGDSAPPLVFDFILIDATNAAQTLGLENLLAFLNPNHILARSAIIFALDSQRDRSGTARSHRHALVRIGDLDVQVQKLCSKLAEAYRSHSNRYRNGGSGRPTATPHVLTSGRGVAGEADYKLLDLQRSLLTSAIAAGATSLPSFLFISEDSDVLCGALCGPAPQQVSIATKLQDVLYEPSILRLDRVLAFIATCTDAFYAENEREASEAAAAKAKAAAERSAAKATMQVPAGPSRGTSSKGSTAAESVAAAPRGALHDTPKPPHDGEGDEEEEVELSVEDKAVSPLPPATEEDVVRRRKQDGPMVATGVRIELTDSSEDDEPEEAKADKKAMKEGNENNGAKKEKEAATTPIGARNGCNATAMQYADLKHEEAMSVESDAAPTAEELTVSTIAYTSSVDMVFLFLMVMGNAVNVPSLVRGTTKVDASSCWQAYCKHKYKILSASEAETGRVLLTTSVNTHSTNKGSLVLNCEFLHSILDALHYADAEARPPGEEEKMRALAYLSNVVYSTLRYVVGCNLEKPPVLQQTFLDSRPLSEAATTLPSLSAVMWVLGQETTRTFTFPLHGLAKKELLSAASCGATNGKGLSGALTTGGGGGVAAGPAQRDAAASVGELDVGEHLVAPVAANAWAVRGARTNTVSLATLLQNYTTTNTIGVPRTNPSSSAALRTAQLPSMTELLKKCLQKVSPTVLPKANVLVYLITVWEYALGMGVRRIAALTKGAAHVARAEGAGETFTAVQTASSASNPMRSADAATAAAKARAKTAAGHYVYSFELRRMAPVLRSTDTPAFEADPAYNTGSGKATANSATVPPSSSAASATTGATSAVQQAILAALGVSYDYSKAPRAPANVVHLPPSAMDEEDKAELQRLKKVAKKERALVASIAGATAATKKSPKDTDASDSCNNAEGAHPSPQQRKVKKDKLKGKKRLGKRERMLRQKAMARPGACVAAAPLDGKNDESS